MGSKKKKRKSSPPAPRQKITFQDRQTAKLNAYRQAEKETYIQFMTDTLVLTLNDPAIMGKDVFGKKRIQRVIKGWGEKYDQYCGALVPGDEADYHQIKLDERLSQIFGDDFEKFGKRYYWLNDLT